MGTEWSSGTGSFIRNFLWDWDDAATGGRLGTAIVGELDTVAHDNFDAAHLDRVYAPLDILDAVPLGRSDATLLDSLEATILDSPLYI